jgi:hypothetical protein
MFFGAFTAVPHRSPQMAANAGHDGRRPKRSRAEGVSEDHPPRPRSFNGRLAQCSRCGDAAWNYRCVFPLSAFACDDCLDFDSDPHDVDLDSSDTVHLPVKQRDRSRGVRGGEEAEDFVSLGATGPRNFGEHQCASEGPARTSRRQRAPEGPARKRTNALAEYTDPAEPIPEAPPAACRREAVTAARAPMGRRDGQPGGQIQAH